MRLSTQNRAESRTAVALLAPASDIRTELSAKLHTNRFYLAGMLGEPPEGGLTAFPSLWSGAPGCVAALLSE